ncbi:ERVV2 protein, partial [Ardeotis kori]|nr:ERVV2 protein [Ardeotis kori]
LASQGGVCTTVNRSCCMSMDQSGRISPDLKEIWEQTKILREVTKDDTSCGFEEVWNKLTSWLPNLAWVKQLFMAATLLGLLILFTCILIQCTFWCCKRTTGSYEEWKSHKLKHQVESGKYFKRT